MFNEINWNAILSKIQNIFSIFFSISESASNCNNFEKKKKKIRHIADFFPKILKRKCVVTYMSKEPCVRPLMESQHVTHDTLLKTTRQWLCHIFWSPWNNFSLKNYILVVSKILRLFDKLWTPGEKFSLAVKVSV